MAGPVCLDAVSSFRFAPRYRGLLWWNGGVQLAFFLLGALALDEGNMFHLFLYASLAFWAGAGLILAWRPERPTRWDLYYLKYGLIVLSLFCLNLFPLAWWLRGIRF